MRVISRRRLRLFWEHHAAAEEPLRRWYQLARNAHWKTPSDVKRTFGSADLVKVKSGNTVTVFNLGGNKYRLVAAVHYDYPRVFVLRVMTHEEYDANKWQEAL